MGLNCKPGQRAWIDIPRSRETLAMGMDQIHGHVVKAVSLLPGELEGPTWVVDPPQSCKVQRTFRAGEHVMEAGQVLHFRGVPDEYLRPFDDLPPEELEDLHVALQRELVS